MSCEELHPLALELHALAGLLIKMDKRDLERRLASCGTSVGALPFSILRILACEKHTIAELGRRMMISPATLVPVVDALERQNLARRGHDPRDRRRTPLSITGEGADLLARVPPVDASDALIRNLEAMGPEKSRELLALLRELVGRMWDGGHPGSRESAVDSIHAAVLEELGRLQTGDSHVATAKPATDDR